MCGDDVKWTVERLKCLYLNLICILTNAHIQKTLIPTFDHLAATNLEWEWLIPVQTVKDSEHLNKSRNLYYFVMLKLKCDKLTKQIKQSAIDFSVSYIQKL